MNCTAETPLRLLETLDHDTRPPRILLAEDDPELRSLIVEALSDEGYEVDPVDSGLDLVTRIRESRLSGEGFDLVLSDVRMPGCSGLVALEVLRKDDWSTPALFMTAFGSLETHGEAQRLGANVIDKPFDLDELLVRVRALVPPNRYLDGWR
ncbi:MAG: response regulator [Planctomycetes bacterium]|nr:response regulator [Planctomycetota bacterium]